jgi:predicted transcriptional regulator
VVSSYHDVMTRKATTVRLPDELAETADVVARAQGISINTLIIGALQIELDRVRQDQDFMDRLRSQVERDQEILDRLAR